MIYCIADGLGVMAEIVKWLKYLDKRDNLISFVKIHERDHNLQ